MFTALAVLPAPALSTYINNLQLIKNSAEPMCTLGWVHAVGANFIQRHSTRERKQLLKVEMKEAGLGKDEEAWDR